MVARNTNLNKHFWIIWPTNLSILSFLMKVNHETGRSHYIWHLSCCYYHWFDTSAGGLLVPEDIIHPLVLSRFWLSCLGSLVFRFQKHLNYWDFQFGLPCADQKRDKHPNTSYKNIPRHLRTCNKCGTLDDENHFFLNCKLNEHLRKAFLSDFDNTNNTNLLEII